MPRFEVSPSILTMQISFMPAPRSAASLKAAMEEISGSSRLTTVEITLTKDDGSPFEVTFSDQGTRHTLRVVLAPGSTRILQTDGYGPLATGPAIVTAKMPLGVSALFSIMSEDRLVSEAGVLATSGRQRMTVPVDNTGGSRVGITLFNYGPSDATLTLAC